MRRSSGRLTRQRRRHHHEKCPPTSSEGLALIAIKNLAAERDYLSLAPRDRSLVESACTGKIIAKYDASKLIDVLKVTVRADATSYRPAFLPTAAPAAQAWPKTERVELQDDALYLKDGLVIHVKRSASGFQCGEVYVEDTERWEYRKGSLFGVTEDHRMTLAQANEVSVRIGRCVRCRRTLTAKESVARGIGPVCATRFGF